MGTTVNYPAGVHGMWRSSDNLDFLVFTPRGEAGLNLPLTPCLSYLGYAIVMISSHGLPQDDVDLHVALVLQRGGLRSSMTRL